MPVAVRSLPEASWGCNSGLTVRSSAPPRSPLQTWSSTRVASASRRWRRQGARCWPRLRLCSAACWRRPAMPAARARPLAAIWMPEALPCPARPGGGRLETSPARQPPLRHPWQTCCRSAKRLWYHYRPASRLWLAFEIPCVRAVRATTLEYLAAISRSFPPCALLPPTQPHPPPPQTHTTHTNPHAAAL